MAHWNRAAPLALAGLFAWLPSTARAEDAAAAPAAATAPATADPAFLGALAEFAKARESAPDGDADRANQTLQRLSESDPQNPLYLAYYGSSWTLKGRDAWAPWNKLRHTEKGAALIDKALSLLGPEHEQQRVRGAPVSIEVRLVAAATFLALPDLFHRREAGKAALQTALASPAFAGAPGSLRAQLHQQAALLARKEGNVAQEQALLQQAAQEWPESKLAAEAARRLAELGK